MKNKTVIKLTKLFVGGGMILLPLFLAQFFVFRQYHFLIADLLIIFLGIFIHYYGKTM